MGNIDVLSVIKPGPKAAKGSQTGAVGNGDTQNAAASFAAIFGDWVQGLGEQKASENEQGQDKVTAAGAKPSGSDPAQADENGFPGLALFAAIAAAVMLQPEQINVSGQGGDPGAEAIQSGSALFTTVPASKEANSGVTTGQTGFWQEAMADLAKGDFKGAWMALSSEGASLNVSELDKYRVQITYLLDQLSGKIETGSPGLADLVAQLKGQDGMAGFLSLLEAKAGAPVNTGVSANGSAVNDETTVNANGKTSIPVTANGSPVANAGTATDAAAGIPVTANGGTVVKAAASSPALANGSTVADAAVSANNEAVAQPVPMASTGAAAGVQDQTAQAQITQNQMVQDGPSQAAQGQQADREITDIGIKETKTSSDQTPSAQTTGADGKEKGVETSRIFNSMSQGEGQKKGSDRESDGNPTFRGEIAYGLFGDKVSVAANRAQGTAASQQNQNVPVWEQVQNALQEKLAGRSELKDLTLQLKPASLGTIQIALHWEEGTVHLHWLASQASTGQALQDKLPELRQSLEHMGVSCGTMEMGLSNGQQQSDRQQEYSREYLGWQVESNSADSPAAFGGAGEEGSGSSGDDFSDGNYKVNVRA